MITITQYQRNVEASIGVDKIANIKYKTITPLSIPLEEGNWRLCVGLKYIKQDGNISYVVNLIHPNFVVIEVACEPEDRVKVEQVISQLDRNFSYEDYKRNLEQAISAALVA